MPEHYPRIYSLSTLNLKQHFNCDYRFHEFRTDFSGESGSGKSMIADFIQLLLVGSGVFHSGTEAIGDREVSGLVAAARGSKYGRGYLLMNVLTAPQKYITLGSYLETTSGHMQSFVISKSYNLNDSLEPLNEPVFYRDLLVDDQIEAVDVLQQRTLDKGYLRVLPLGKYHRLLYESGILAVDLSQSKQSLASFAAIIRSFSRGKGYFNKSAALKTFLFGDDDHNKLLERYHEEVGQIKLDQSQHDQLIGEIDQIREKQEQIVNVTSRFREFQRLRQRFSQESASFWQRRLDETLGDMTQAEQAHHEARLRHILIQQKALNTSVRDIETQHRDWSSLQNAVRLAEANNLTWERKELEAKTQLDESIKFKTMIDLVKVWQSGERSDLHAVRSWYVAQKQKLTDQESLRQFEKYLDERSLRAKFESSAWYKEPNTGRQVTQTELDHFNIQEQQLQTRLTFTDFNDPASLGSWALEHLSLPLSLEQESLLVHFQKLKRTPPAIPADRYLAMPEALFPNPVTSPANEAGFWVNLSGIYEFIPFVSDQLLNVPRSELNVVELSRDELQAKLTAVSEKKQQLQYLQDQLAAFSGLEHTIGLYRSAASSLFEEPDEIGELTSSVFERHLQAYETREIHLAKVSKDQQAYQAAHQQFMSGKNSSVIGAGGSKKIIEYMQQQYGSADFDDLVTKKRMELAEWDEALNALLEKQEVSVKDVQRNQTVLFGNAPALIRLFEMQTTAHTEYGDTLKRLETLEETLKSATLRRNQAITKFMQDHKRDFDPVKDLLVVDGDPNEQSSIDAKSKFEAAYELAGKRVEDQTVLKDHAVGVLAHQLLPTVFPTYDIQEELIEEKIDRRLSDLINELKKIGSRKVEILHQIFTQVQNTYNAQLTQVNNIANYLRNKNHGITGGNQATLVPKSAPGYPDGWMKVFRKRLSDELQHTGLFEAAERQDIEQIMVDIFREHKGTREATYKDLLNPLSYFDLHFTMKLDDGQGNVGSNGQTYTANALLCLARLSLIEEKDRTGIRIMPIDEAEGLGGNYEMLHALAQREGYQIVTMSIETAGDLRNGGQYVYIMHDNRQANSESYVPPLGIFNNGPITKHIDDIFKEA